MASPSSIAARVQTLRAGLEVLINVIEGKKTLYSLGEGEGQALERHWRKVGVELISETRGRKLGLVLKKGARPLMSRYFGAPISDYIFLYDRATAFRPKAGMKEDARG